MIQGSEMNMTSQLYQRDTSELDLVCAVDAAPMNLRSSNYEIVDQPSTCPHVGEREPA